jgi:Flp pilus assembly protein TadG
MRPTPPRQVKTGERGTATVEFALILPLLLLVLLALVQTAIFVRDRLLVESATHAAVRAAAVQLEETAVREAVQAAAPGLDPAALGVVVERGGTRGDPVKVSVSYPALVRVPMIAWLLPSGITMHAEATARQEFG